MSHFYSGSGLLLLSLLGLTGCAEIFPAEGDSPPVEKAGIRASDTPDNEVRAALVQLMRISGEKDQEAFRLLIYPPDLIQFDADEGERRGSYLALMNEIASHKVRDYRIEVTGKDALAIPDHPDRRGLAPAPGRTLALALEGGSWRLKAFHHALLSQASESLSGKDERPSKPISKPRSRKKG